MRIATSTNLVSFNPDGSKTPMVDLLPLYAASRFSLLDLNWCEMMNPASPLRGPGWESYVDRIALLAKELGLAFNQSHAPYARRIGDHSMDALILRALACDARLGVPLIVLHPLAAEDPVRENADYLRPFVREAERLGVRIALENLEGNGEIHQAQDLLRLLDALESPMVGICLDTGHAWMRGLDPSAEAEAYGASLWATHIADNHGVADEHLLPFGGTINWIRFVRTLRGMGYAGDLTFECMKQNARLPAPLKPEAIRHALAIGTYLLSL